MFRFIDGANNRHLWGLVFSLPIQFLMYREMIILWWFVQMASYLFVVVLGKKGIVPVFLVSFLVLEY